MDNPESPEHPICPSGLFKRFSYLEAM